MIKIIKHAVIKNAWLFFAAAWVYTVSFIFTNYFSYSSSPEKVARILSEYIHGQEKSFNNILNDTATVAAIINDAPSPLKKQLLSDAQGIFAYQVNDLGNPVKIFWNTNKMSPGNDDISKPDGSYLVNYQNGVFELVKTSLTGKQQHYFFVMLIPVRWQYPMENEYLHSHFAVNEAIDKEYAIAPAGEGAPVINSTGKTLFSIREISQRLSDSPAGFSIFLRVIAVVFFLVFINNVASETGRKRNFRTGFMVLLAGFLAFRIIIYFLPFPFNYRDLSLFNEKNYSGGIINRSLGDLLLNALLSLWALTFFRKKINTTAIELLRDYPLIYKALTFASFFLIPATTFYFANVISGLVTHSKISFNAADFFSLTLFSLTGFIIICIMLYIWLYLTGIFIQLAAQTKIVLFWQYIIILACSFLLITLHVFLTDAKLLLLITGYILFIIAFIRYRDNPSFSSLVSSSYFIVWALITTAGASALLVYQNNISEKQNRIKTARSLQEQTDSSATYLIRLALKNFTDEFFENNFYRFKNANNSRYLKDSLINKTLPGFITKYNTTIYLFDNNNAPLFNEDSSTYTIINSVLENRSKPTSMQGLSFYRKDDSYNYIYEKKIEKDSVILGSLFIHIQPRLLENTAIVPELFKQKNEGAATTGSNYLYGIYNYNRLVSSFANFGFPDSITADQIPKTGYYFKDSIGYSQLWYNAGNNRMIIVAREKNAFSNFITLFSYLFVLFIILSFVVHNSRIILENRSSAFSFRNLFRFNIRTQIQTTIVGVSIVSFLIIGIATISFFILRFTKSTKQELINVSQIMASEIEQALKSEISSGDPEDFIEFGSGAEFDKKILDIASIHNADINLYAKNGALLVTSQPYMYNQEILSNRMEPKAFYALHYNQSTRYDQPEKIGNFDFESVYIPIKDEKETIAYLNTPTLSAQDELKEEISDFLVTLIILNALIFIFAGAISVALTGRITSSLEFIGNKMKEIKIGAANEEIPWQRNDEIGMLVNEYNRMVKQLEQSAQVLAKSEREGAWREMARQVAHEIKNPLTPMKLSIQYLQRAMENNTPNAVDLSKKLASTLVEQIDQLSKIAGDFSQFANIENINPERFNISVLVQNLVNLYRADANLIINYATENNNAEVFSDKAQINRLFTNLIKNAIEAYEEPETPRIQISQYTQPNDVIIAVTDYGSGINESLRNKIFNPNFTTKSSGTGLGLAICKAIVENAGGRIWFTTSEGAGTSFYVRLPLAHITHKLL